MRTLVIVAAALLLAACASDKDFLRAQADAAVAAGNARVAEAQAAAEQARAVQALAPKIDAGGASAYLVATALKGLTSPASTPSAPAVQRPRDFLDYLAGFAGLVGAVANIAVPIVTVKEGGKTARAGYERDLGVEQARQLGETSRTQAISQIARDVAANTPQPNITLSGTGVIGSGSYTGPVTTTTTTNCNGGTAAPGGNGGNGAGTGAGGTGAPGGSAAGGDCR